MHPKLRHSHTHTKNSAALLLSFFPHLHIAPPCPTLFSSKLLDLICKVFHLGHDDTEDLQTLSQGEPAATYDTAPSLGPTPTPAAIVVNALAAVILSLLFYYGLSELPLPLGSIFSLLVSYVYPSGATHGFKKVVRAAIPSSF